MMETMTCLSETDQVTSSPHELKYTLQTHNPNSFAQACKTVIVDYADQHPDFAVLANIAPTIPASSVP